MNETFPTLGASPLSAALAPASNGLDICAIEPSVHGKYSPNLYRWLTNKRNKFESRAHVYEDGDGALWIGQIDYHWFTGCRLAGVLCYGSEEQIFAHPHKASELKVVADFWQRYVRDGRCAIDPKHEANFMNDRTRWSVVGDARSCLWCGDESQLLTRWIDEAKKETWISAAPAKHAPVTGAE